jgi:tRNA wybutosine-synthesizing protein 3
MSPSNNFFAEKKNAISKFNEAKVNQAIDKNMIPTLEIINSCTDYYTTSSCSGRALLIELDQPGSKKKSNMLSRWHEEFSLSDLKFGIDRWEKYRYLYFIAQSPILHVTTNNLDSAILLRNLFESAGFKYSSIRSIKPIKSGHNKKEINVINRQEIRITVELLSTERLNVPLGIEGSLIVNGNYLTTLTKLANDLLIESTKKIENLNKILKQTL